MLRAIFAAAVCAFVSQPALARDQIRVVGSGTLYPFVTIAAEQFGQDGKFKTPLVESTGTGGGFKLFCEGTGEDKPDINNASRKIMASEKEACIKNGVIDPIEIQLGYDGIILANKKGAPHFNLTKKQIFMALARKLPDTTGALQPNSYQSWSDIDPALPNQPIKIYGPGTASGTRDAFTELVLEKGCAQFEAFTVVYPDEKTRKKTCQSIREDGKYVEMGEDPNIMVRKLMSDEQAFGIFGYSFYEQNLSKIQASKIEGISPDVETILSGQYGIARGLYVYIKRQHIGVVPGMVEFIRELTSGDAIGYDGYIADRGLIPLKSDDLKALQETIAAMK